MKKLMLKLGSVKERLTNEQMKKIIGGNDYLGTCGYIYAYNGDTPYSECDVSQEYAELQASKGDWGHWCCDSCSSSSYC